MSETVVHVKTLDQWKSVLDVWFEQGYAWPMEDKEYSEHIFENGGRFLFLDDYITYSFSNPDSKPFIEYEEFVAQQKKDNKMATYYVTQEQLDLIEELKSLPSPLVAIMNKKYEIETIYNELSLSDKEWLRYLGGDETVEFKVKERLLRLWRVDEAEDTVYMKFSYGTPDWTPFKCDAFTAPLDEIKKWLTPAWSIEEVN